MGEKESVRAEAIEKIRQHISEATICLVTNTISEWSLQPESLSDQLLDRHGNIWFRSLPPASGNNTCEGPMEVFYSNRIKGKFLSIVGDVTSASAEEFEAPAQSFHDKHKMDDAGPSFRWMKLSPQEAFYWDETLLDMVPLLLFNTFRSRPRKLVA